MTTRSSQRRGSASDVSSWGWQGDDAEEEQRFTRVCLPLGLYFRTIFTKGCMYVVSMMPERNKKVENTGWGNGRKRTHPHGDHVYTATLSLVANSKFGRSCRSSAYFSPLRMSHTLDHAQPSKTNRNNHFASASLQPLAYHLAHSPNHVPKPRDCGSLLALARVVEYDFPQICLGTSPGIWMVSLYAAGTPCRTKPVVITGERSVR